MSNDSKRTAQVDAGHPAHRIAASSTRSRIESAVSSLKVQVYR